MKTLAITKKDDDLSEHWLSSDTAKVKNYICEGTILCRKIWMKCYTTFAIENELYLPT
jgi:hypothetical protein